MREVGKLPEVERVKEIVGALEDRVRENHDETAHDALFYLLGYVQQAAKFAAKHFETASSK